MASFRSTVAYPAELVGDKGGIYWMQEHQAGGHIARVLAKNRIANGEIWPENPAGLPRKSKYHKKGVEDEDWYMRHCDRAKVACAGKYTYCPETGLLQKGFGYNAMPKHHSRRIFKKLARQGHSFSEGNLQVLKDDSEARRAMARRYKEVMRAPL